MFLSMCVKMGVHASTFEDMCTCMHIFVEGSLRATLNVISQNGSVCRRPEVPQTL